MNRQFSTPQVRSIYQPLIPNNFSKTSNNISMSPRSEQLSTYKKERPVYHPIEFYAHGKPEKDPKYSTFYIPNVGYKSEGNDIIDRNYISINNRNFRKKYTYKQQAVLGMQNTKDNNYMKPLTQYKKFESLSSTVSPRLSNKETYNISKKILFNLDTFSQVKRGKHMENKEFKEKKENIMENKNNKETIKMEYIYPEIDERNKVYLNETGDYESEFERKYVKNKNSKTAYICGNNKGEYKSPFDSSIKHLSPSILSSSPKVQNFQGIRKQLSVSGDAPDWFQVFPEWKEKAFWDKMAKNEDSLRVFSRFQNWITVNSKTKDRRHPLEKTKEGNMEKTSKIMPKWMQIQSKQKKDPEIFKSIEYYPIRQKAKGMMVWVDNDINQKKIKPKEYNKNRSIFSYNDFRNNVVTKKQAEYYGSMVSQMPKKFFDWDDGKKFNPKYKKDI